MLRVARDARATRGSAGGEATRGFKPQSSFPSGRTLEGSVHMSPGPPMGPAQAKVAANLVRLGIGVGLPRSRSPGPLPEDGPGGPRSQAGGVAPTPPGMQAGGLAATTAAMQAAGLAATAAMQAGGIAATAAVMQEQLSVQIVQMVKEIARDEAAKAIKNLGDQLAQRLGDVQAHSELQDAVCVKLKHSLEEALNEVEATKARVDHLERLQGEAARREHVVMDELLKAMNSAVDPLTSKVRKLEEDVQQKTHGIDHSLRGVRDLAAEVLREHDSRSAAFQQLQQRLKILEAGNRGGIEDSRRSYASKADSVGGRDNFDETLSQTTAVSSADGREDTTTPLSHARVTAAVLRRIQESAGAHLGASAGAGASSRPLVGGLAKDQLSPQGSLRNVPISLPKQNPVSGSMKVPSSWERLQGQGPTRS